MATLSNPAGELVMVSIPTATIESLRDPSTDPSNASTSPTPDAAASSSPRKRSVFGKLDDKYRKLKDKQHGKHNTFVRVPREEYEKYFKRDEKGRYIGTEPEGCEAGLEVLKLCLENETMQSVGKKDVEREIVENWRPLNERSGFTHTAVSHTGYGGGGV